MQDARESQSDYAPWERVLRAIHDFKSDLGGLRKSVDEHGVKIKALTQAKQRNAGKENIKEQKSGTPLTKAIPKPHELNSMYGVVRTP